MPAAERFEMRRIAVAAFGPSLLFGLGKGAILPVIALSVVELGGSVALAALVVTLTGIGSLAGNLPASLATARFGERAAILAASALGAFAMLACALVADLFAFAAGVFLVGVASSVFNLARQSYLTEAVPVAFRARALSTLGGVARIGAFVGPFAGAGLIHFLGLAGAYWVGVAALLAAGLVAAGLPDLPDARAPGHAPDMPAPTLRSITVGHMRIFLTVGVGVMLVSAVRASRQVVVPLWAEHIGLDAATTSLIYGLAGAVDMAVFYPAGKLMDVKGRNWVAVPSMAIMGSALLGVPFTEGTTSLLLAAMLIGFGNGIGSGMVMTLGADYSPSPGRAHFLGIWRLLSDLGATGGPLLLSAVTAAVSLAAGIVSSGLLAFAGAAVLGYWIPRANRRLLRSSR